MTREEALKILKECRDKRFNRTIYTVEEYHTAVDMAIKALEYDDAKYHEEHGEVIVDKGLWEDAKKALEQEPKIVPIAEIKFDDDKLHEIVEEAVKNIEIEPKWIPVSERLPDDGGVFLVTTVGKSVNGENDIYSVEIMSLWHKDGHLEWKDDFSFESKWYNKKAVAWMPLPEPYKESEG